MELDLRALKIERIEGAVTFGEIFSFQGDMDNFAPQLQRRLYETVRQIDNDARLEFTFRREEGKDPMVVVLCRRPQFMFQASKDGMAFRFDDVYDYERIVPPLASTYYETGIEFFKIDFFLRSGMEFQNIFDFAHGYRNTDLFAERLVPQLKEPTGVFQCLGPMGRVYRTDLRLSFPCREKDVFLRLEAPANDDNATLWCSVDVRSNKPKVPKEEVVDFKVPHDYYTSEYAAFLAQLLEGKELDMRKRALLKS